MILPESSGHVCCEQRVGWRPKIGYTHGVSMQANTLNLVEDFSWCDELPASLMVYPERLAERLKYHFWRVYTPYHTFVRDTAMRFSIVRRIRLKIIGHAGKQEFLIGKVAPNLSVREFVSRLLEKGFGNHFVAWKDDGQIVSLRYVENFTYQYHLRVFADREVRVHYEYTPECRPIAHFFRLGQEERREDFLRFLGDSIIPAR